MESLKTKVEKFLEIEKDYFVYGDGYGDGSGNGSGFGYGFGSGYSSGFGFGYNFGNGYGDGSGDGYGFGSGFGSGYSSGFGSGYNFGNGSGDGSGDGYGFGKKRITQINELPTFIVDDTLTAFSKVKGNIAKGFIVRSNLTFTPCFVVKQDNTFAHGKTLHKAMEALRDKLFDDLPEEERISAFMESHELEKEYPNEDFFSWHHRLTGSCEAGRLAFAKDHQIDLNGSMTTKDFLALTRNNYGGEVIRKVEEKYQET